MARLQYLGDVIGGSSYFGACRGCGGQFMVSGRRAGLDGGGRRARHGSKRSDCVGCGQGWVGRFARGVSRRKGWMMSQQKVLDEARKLLAKAERDAAGCPLLDSLCSADLDGLDEAIREYDAAPRPTSALLNFNPDGLVDPRNQYDALLLLATVCRSKETAFQAERIEEAIKTLRRLVENTH